MTVIYFILERAQSLGFLRSKIQCLYHSVKLSSWQELKRQDKLFSLRTCCTRLLVFLLQRLSSRYTIDPQLLLEPGVYLPTRFHFIRACVEKALLEVEHVPGNEQKADI